MSRLPILIAVMVPLLGACSNAPEQPSEIPDREPQLLDPLPDITDVDADVDGEADGDLRISGIPEASDDDVAAADLFGGWAGDESECTAAAGPPVTISSSRYEDIAGSCEINELISNGDGFTASMSCERDGATEAQLLKLTPDGDTLVLSWVARDLPAQTLVRCDE